MSADTDQVVADVQAAGCQWPVGPCPCVPGRCPVRIGFEQLAPNEPARPPYGAFERIVAGFDEEPTS